MRPWPALPATPALLLLVTRLSAIDVEFYIGDKLVPLRYDPADDLHVVAAAFTERHDLDRAAAARTARASSAARRAHGEAPRAARARDHRRRAAAVLSARRRRPRGRGATARRRRPAHGAGCAEARAASCRGPRSRAHSRRAREARPPRAPKRERRAAHGRAVLRGDARSRRRVGPRGAARRRGLWFPPARDTVVHDVARALRGAARSSSPRRTPCRARTLARATVARAPKPGRRAAAAPGHPARRRVARRRRRRRRRRAAAGSSRGGVRAAADAAEFGRSRPSSASGEPRARGRGGGPRGVRARAVGHRARPLAPRTCATRCSARRRVAARRRRDRAEGAADARARAQPERAGVARAIFASLADADDVLARASIAALDVLVINAEGADLGFDAMPLDRVRPRLIVFEATPRAAARRRRERREPAPAHASGSNQGRV